MDLTPEQEAKLSTLDRQGYDAAPFRSWLKGGRSGPKPALKERPHDPRLSVSAMRPDKPIDDDVELAPQTGALPAAIRGVKNIGALPGNVARAAISLPHNIASQPLATLEEAARGATFGATDKVQTDPTLLVPESLGGHMMGKLWLAAAKKAGLDISQYFPTEEEQTAHADEDARKAPGARLLGGLASPINKFIPGGIAGGAALNSGLAASDAVAHGKDPLDAAIEGGTTALGVGAAGAGLGKLAGNGANAYRARNIQPSRNIRAVEAVGGSVGPTKVAIPEATGIDTPGGRVKFSDVDPRATGRGRGELADAASQSVLPKVSKSLEDARAGFKATEDAHLAKTPGQVVDPSPLMTTLREAINSKSIDGNPLIPDQVSRLESQYGILENAVTSRGQRNALTLEELVRFRRAMDELGHMGKMAGERDIPYRKLRTQAADMIEQQSPELASQYKRYAAEIAKAETAHDALVGRHDADLPDGAAMETRAGRNISKYGEDSDSAPSRDRAIDAVKRDFPDAGKDIDVVRAKRAKDELSYFGNGGSVQMTPQGPRVLAGVGRGADLAASRGMYPGLRAIEGGLRGKIQAAARADVERRKKKGN